MDALKNKWTIIWLVVFIVLMAASIPDLFKSKKKKGKDYGKHESKQVESKDNRDKHAHDDHDKHADHDDHKHADEKHATHADKDDHQKHDDHGLADEVKGHAATDFIMEKLHYVPGYKGWISFFAAIFVVLFAKKGLKYLIQVKDPEEEDAHAH